MRILRATLGVLCYASCEGRLSCFLVVSYTKVRVDKSLHKACQTLSKGCQRVAQGLLTKGFQIVVQGRQKFAKGCPKACLRVVKSKFMFLLSLKLHVRYGWVGYSGQCGASKIVYDLP